MNINFEKLKNKWERDADTLYATIDVFEFIRISLTWAITPSHDEKLFKKLDVIEKEWMVARELPEHEHTDVFDYIKSKMN